MSEGLHLWAGGDYITLRANLQKQKLHGIGLPPHLVYHYCHRDPSRNEGSALAKEAGVYASQPRSNSILNCKVRVTHTKPTHDRRLRPIPAPRLHIEVRGGLTTSGELIQLPMSAKEIAQEVTGAKLPRDHLKPRLLKKAMASTA